MALADLEYDPTFLAREAADAAMATLSREVPFRQEDIVLFGRRIAQPRLSLWMGDEGAVYKYSGVTREPHAWHPLVRELADAIALRCGAGTRFDSVLLNLYRDGKDSMGFHSDDEPELGPEPVIASLSLGATRTFVIKPKKKSDAAKVEAVRMRLEHGSLLVMRGTFQRDFVHGVPKERTTAGPRVNMTFRTVGFLPGSSLIQ